MLKVILAFVFASGLGFAALADDGGVVAISVNDLKFGNSSWDNNGNTVLKPLPVNDTVNYSVQANGKEAVKLMQILPSQLSVMTAMYKKFPKWIKTYNDNFKTLEMTGAPGQPAVDITCLGGTMEYADGGNEKNPPKFVAFADGAHCSILVAPKSEDGDKEYNFDPRKAICH